MEAGFAYALTDDQLVLGTSRATVEALLAVHRGGGDSLADRDDVSDLADRLPAERAGVMTVDVAALMASMRDQMGATDTELRDLLDEQLASLPDVVVSSLSFEDDAIRVDGAMSVPAGDPAPANTTRSLAASVPGDAIFFADAPNLGASASSQLARLREQLESGGASGELDQLQQVEAALGGRLDELFTLGRRRRRGGRLGRRAGRTWAWSWRSPTRMPPASACASCRTCSAWPPWIRRPR